MDDRFYLIAVHGGAGFHAQSSEGEVKKALRLACKRGLALLEQGSSAVHVVEEAICILEDDPCLNAGYGSNLTLSGQVECDASIMDGHKGDFGSVGAVSGIKNPIKLAGAILQHSFNPDRLGRIPPLTLVSGGAQHFAQLQGLKLVSPESLIAPRAQQEWSRWRQMLEPTDTVHRGSDKPGSTNVLYLDPTSASTPNTSTSYGGIQDTVGAIAWNAEGALAAGVSSGGLLLKDSGRIGEAAVYGAGCWAKQPLAVSARGVACSVSGAGEYIIRSLLAKSIGDAVYESDRGDTHSDIQQVLDNHFSTVRHGNDQRESSAGLLLLLKEQGAFSDVIPRLWCAFTTESMAVAYASSLDPKPKALILRRPEQYRTDTSSVYITALPLTRV